VYSHIYIYIYIYIHMCIYIYTCVYVYTCMYMYLYIYIHMCICIYMYVYACMYMHIHVCIWIHTCNNVDEQPETIIHYLYESLTVIYGRFHWKCSPPTHSPKRTSQIARYKFKSDPFFSSVFVLLDTRNPSFGFCWMSEG